MTHGYEDDSLGGWRFDGANEILQTSASEKDSYFFVLDVGHAFVRWRLCRESIHRTTTLRDGHGDG